MPISEYYRALRECLGTRLLLVPAVAAVVRDRHGSILLQQQHDDSWSLPAGAVEPGESPSQAVVREVKEETGLAVVPEKILAVLGGESCRVRYPNEDEVEYVVTVFECSEFGGTLVESNEETKNLAYFRANSLPPLSFPYPAEVFTGGEAYFSKNGSPGRDGDGPTNN